MPFGDTDTDHGYDDVVFGNEGEKPVAIRIENLLFGFIVLLSRTSVDDL